MNKFMLVGLGNPGPEYDSTRHNAGKLFTRYLREHPIEGVEAVETACYMNESGEWLQRELQQRGIRSSTGTTGTTSRNEVPQVSRVEVQHGTRGTFGTSDTRGTSLIVAHDDLDIPLGKFKIQFGKGPRQHKGILSIEDALGMKEFWRIRIGIDARERKEKKKVDKDNEKKIETTKEGEEYVLSPLSREERDTLAALFPEIREQLRILFRSI